MNPLSPARLATLFTAGGAVLGLPSIAYLVLYGVLMLRQRFARPVQAPDFGVHPDAVLTVLQGFTQVAGGIANLAGSLAQVVLDMAAAAAAATLVLAAAAWFTGRGLHGHAPWARVSGGALLVLLLLAALVMALALRGLGRLVMLGVVGFALFGLHALWAGGRAPPG